VELIRRVRLAPHVRGGKLRGLAVSHNKRLPIAADIPTFAEAGVPDFEVSQWQGLMAPARAAPQIVMKITGIDLTVPVTREDFRAIWEAFNEHQVLVFHGQPFDDETQMAFSQIHRMRNEIWHTDSSFKPVPALASLLSGRVVPPAGGNTELGELGPDSIVPISEKPADLSIVVAGGPGSHSVFVPVSAHTRSVTREVVLSQ
jgi:hypothetical protein